MRRWLAAVCGAVALLVVTWLFAPRLPVPPAAGAVIAFVLTCGTALAVARFAPGGPLRVLAWLVVPALALAFVASLGERAAGVVPAALVAAALLAGGTLIGGVIGARIEHPSHLSVAAYASSSADLFSVLSPGGPTARVAESERLLSLVAIGWPVPGTSAIEPLLGVGDVILCAVYLSAARALGLSVNRTTLALALGFAAVLSALLLLFVPLPALPFLGLAVVLAHPETRRFRPHERRRAALGLLVLTVLFAVLWAVNP